MRIDDRGLDDSKAFEVAKIVEAAQKVFTRKRFENRVKLMLEKSRDPEDDSDSEESDEDPDEDEESDVEEDEDSRTDVLTARDLRKGKERRVTFREPERPVETATRPTSDTPVNELIDKMRRLQLTDRILTACIEGFFDVKKGVENAIKSTNFISKFCTLKSVIKLKLFQE
jgi:hypothetical protein